LVGTSTHPKVSVNTRKSWVCIRTCGRVQTSDPSVRSIEHST